jgi:hypothetical protein
VLCKGVLDLASSRRHGSRLPLGQGTQTTFCLHHRHIAAEEVNGFRLRRWGRLRLVCTLLWLFDADGTRLDPGAGASDGTAEGMAASASWPRCSATMAAHWVRTGARFTLILSASLTLAAFRTLHGKRHLGGLRMSRWTREQRFDLRVLIVIALLIFVVSVLMLTVGRDMFWGAVG